MTLWVDRVPHDVAKHYAISFVYFSLIFFLCFLFFSFTCCCRLLAKFALVSFFLPFCRRNTQIYFYRLLKFCCCCSVFFSVLHPKRIRVYRKERSFFCDFWMYVYFGWWERGSMNCHCCSVFTVYNLSMSMVAYVCLYTHKHQFMDVYKLTRTRTQTLARMHYHGLTVTTEFEFCAASVWEFWSFEIRLQMIFIRFAIFFK